MEGVHLVIGASSGIGRAVAHELAAQGADLILASRNLEQLDQVANDIKIRHNVSVAVEPLDVSDFAAHADFVQRCTNRDNGKPFRGVIACQGYMASQEDAAADFELARRMIDVNFTANVSLLNRFADHLESEKTGYICGISSVAGDRGRQSNYLYGCTKAAFTCYLQGLRNRLFKHGVSVTTVKPGFVDTAMTWGLLDPNSPMVAKPEQVAKDIVRGIRKKKNTIYTLWFWRIIMTIICSIPESVFKRLSL